MGEVERSATPPKFVESRMAAATASPGDTHLPSDWPLVPLGTLCSFGNGVNADKSAYGKGIPFINVLEVITHTHLRAPHIPGRVRLPKSVLEAFAVRHGDILFNRTSETQTKVGLAAVYADDEPVVFGGFVIRGRFASAALDPTYAGYALRAPTVRSQIVSQGQGAIRANIGQENLKRILVPVPSQNEQRAIAKALADADELVGSLEALVAKKRDIKQAAMQELLTGRTRLPGFAGAWEARRLDELARMASGGTPPTSVAAYYDGEIPWVSISDMTESGKVIRDTERNLSHLGLENSAAHILPAGTVLYAMYASLGECSVSGRPVCTSQAILGIQPGPSLTRDFLYYWLSWTKGTVRVLGQQGTQANLNKGIVRGLRIRLPPVPEQRAIAAVLSDMDEESVALERRLGKTHAIKRGLMQELLAGRIRLPIPPDAPEEDDVRDV